VPFFSRAVVTAALMVLSGSALGAQEVRPRILSPRDSSRQTIGQANVVVEYGRPSKRRRVIFGALVPYDVVWRTGANEATHLRTDRDLTIGGARVPRGTYTLWTIPGRESWTLIINRATGQWGTDYDKSQDLARVPMKVTTLDESVEQFTIAIAPKETRAGVLTMTWDTTQASVPIQVEK
jgi:hypothetical protein